MTKDEALDLALEALETLARYENPETRVQVRKSKDNGPIVTMYPHKVATDAITAIKQARSAPVQEPVWCGHCNGSGRMVRDPDIGTDQECFVCDGAGVPAAPVQEPVAWMHTMIDDVVVGHRPADLNVHPDRWMPLYKDPTPCQTCQALARTVMMDQTAHDTTPPAARPAVPDAFGTREGEHPQYIQGWNDCRAEMLRGMKP